MKEATCVFRTSRTSGISPFFYILVLTYFYLFFPICLLYDFFLTNFENEIFHEIPAAANMQLQPRLRLRPKISAADWGTSLHEPE